MRSVAGVGRGVVARSDKYVKSDTEAIALGKSTVHACKRQVSLEAERRELTAGRRRVQVIEMPLDPVATGPPFVDRVAVDRPSGVRTEARNQKAGFCWRADDNPAHRDLLGSAASEGNGKHHNTSVLVELG